MKININKDKSIEIGDIVEHKSFLCMVIFDESSDFCYVVVNLDTFNIINEWKTLEKLALECKLVEKKHNLKLEVI